MRCLLIICLITIFPIFGFVIYAWHIFNNFCKDNDMDKIHEQ